MINNISNNVVHGSVERLAQDYHLANFTEGQAYLLIGGVIVILALLCYCAYDIIRVITAKSCIGCKRLVNCEKAIKKLQEKK